MRRDLDIKIVQMRPDKLIPVIGKDIMEKIRYYSRKYRMHLNVETNELSSKPITPAELVMAPENEIVSASQEASSPFKRSSASPKRMLTINSNNNGEVRVEEELLTPRGPKAKF